MVPGMGRAGEKYRDVHRWPRRHADTPSHTHGLAQSNASVRTLNRNTCPSMAVMAVATQYRRLIRSALMATVNHRARYRHRLDDSAEADFAASGRFPALRPPPRWVRRRMWFGRRKVHV